MILHLAVVPFLLALSTALVHAESSQMNQTNDYTNATQGAKIPLAAGAKKQVPLSAQKNVQIIYAAPDWNTDSEKVDTATIVLREGKTDDLVKIVLVETAPDSGVFAGSYSASLGQIEGSSPSFYIPPPDFIRGNEDIATLKTLINDGRVKRKPFVLRRLHSGQQVVQLYDTKEQALAAYTALHVSNEVYNSPNRKVVPDAALDASERAEDKADRSAAAQAHAEQLKIKSEEEPNIAERMRTFSALSATEQSIARQNAAGLASDAMAAYRLDKYVDAKAKYEHAKIVDPENKTYLYQYGVVLFKTGDYNRAVVFLQLGEGKDVNTAERDYYLALAFYKLRDFPLALWHFTRVRDAKAEISPSAEFYRGLIFFEKRKYEDAQISFQSVLDTSKDPQLDSRAESFIEQVLRVKQFEAERARKWAITGTVGTMYDSNVLTINGDTLTPDQKSDIGGIRWLTQGSLKYRPVYEADHEFAMQLDAMNMYSTRDDFKYSQTLRDADPFLLSLTAPYTFKGVVWGKGYKLDIVPGSELLYMSAENGTNKLILDSYFVNFLSTLVMSESWFTNYNLELRDDHSRLDSSTGDDDASAYKYKFTYSNLNFLTKDRAKMLTSSAALTYNDAVGKNSEYKRADLSIGYISSWIWDLTYNANLGYYYQTYDLNPSGRVDNDLAVTAALSRKLSDILSAGLVGIYTHNDSTVETNRYNKFSILLNLSANYAF